MKPAAGQRTGLHSHLCCCRECCSPHHRSPAAGPVTADGIRPAALSHPQRAPVEKASRSSAGCWRCSSGSPCSTAYQAQNGSAPAPLHPSMRPRSIARRQDRRIAQSRRPGRMTGQQPPRLPARSDRAAAAGKHPDRHPGAHPPPSSGPQRPAQLPVRMPTSRDIAALIQPPSARFPGHGSIPSRGRFCRPAPPWPDPAPSAGTGSESLANFDRYQRSRAPERRPTQALTHA